MPGFAMDENKQKINIIIWMILHIVLTGKAEYCGRLDDCYSCASRDCVWCPLDEKCYSESLLLSNSQCGRNESVTSTKKCGNNLFEAYDAAVAYENVLLTTVADTNKSKECLQKLFPGKDYQIVATISVHCDDFFFTYQNCYAYVGVNHSKKKIIVAYRGTKNVKQLVEEALVSLAFPKQPFEAGGRVQVYFYNAHLKLYNKTKYHVIGLQSKYPDYRILVLGHSLGGAIASLASASLVYENITQSNRLTLYTFGMPRVGNQQYARAHDRLVPNSYRLVHYRDIVVHLPACWKLCSTSAVADIPFHHGREVFYPNKKMTRESKFKLCRGDEDSNCSDGLISRDPCLMDIFTCFDDHRYYFGIEISNYCDHILAPL